MKTTNFTTEITNRCVMSETVFLFVLRGPSSEPAKICDLGRVVQKPVNPKPGLKANRKIHFSFVKMFFTAYVLCILRFFKLRTEEQTI